MLIANNDVNKYMFPPDSGDEEENFRIFWAAVDTFDEEEIEREDELNICIERMYLVCDIVLNETHLTF